MPKNKLWIFPLLLALLIFGAFPAQAADCTGDEGGCQPGFGGLLPTPDPGNGAGNDGGSGGPPGNPPGCPAPQVFPGAISLAALKLAPTYPLVIGQDESKRGVDARWEIRIEPTAYVTWSAVPEYGRECRALASGQAANCTRSNGLPGRFREVQTGWRCEAATTYYPEGVSAASLAAQLSQASRDWILTGDLQIRYPGADLHNPEMTFSGGHSWFTSNTYHFVYEQTNIPFADPGHWELSLSGQTSGTPVSAPRNFGGVGGTLAVYLRETTIIK